MICSMFYFEGPENSLQRRILMHIAHRQNDEKKLLEYHNSLGEDYEDQLSLASIHFLRTQYQEAIDIYKKILLNNRQLSIKTLNLFIYCINFALICENYCFIIFIFLCDMRVLS